MQFFRRAALRLAAMGLVGVFAMTCEANLSLPSKASSCPLKDGIPSSGRALVVGNGEYARSRLRSPAIDAELLEKALCRAGYTVTRLTDLTAKEILAEVKAFAIIPEGTRRPERALFYFSGRGRHDGVDEQIGGINAGVDRDNPESGFVSLADVANLLRNAVATPVLVIDTDRGSYDRKVGVTCSDPTTVTLYASTADTTAFDSIDIGVDRKMSPFAVPFAAMLVDTKQTLKEAFPALARTVDALAWLGASTSQVPELCDAGGHAAKLTLNPLGRTKAPPSDTLR